MTCDECGGGGETDCPELLCGGMVPDDECETCGGTGTAECDECEGSGSIEDEDEEDE